MHLFPQETRRDFRTNVFPLHIQSWEGMPEGEPEARRGITEGGDYASNGREGKQTCHRCTFEITKGAHHVDSDRDHLDAFLGDDLDDPLLHVNEKARLHLGDALPDDVDAFIQSQVGFVVAIHDGKRKVGAVSLGCLALLLGRLVFMYTGI